MKRIAKTSRDALNALESSLPRREAAVLDALARMTRHGAPPTAYELLKFMLVADPTLDLNAVRPRLTALKGAGLVQTTTKRSCTVTEKRVYTWSTANQPSPAPADRSRPRPQELLF